MRKDSRNGGLNRVACWCRKTPAIFFTFILIIITITETFVMFVFHRLLQIHYGPAADISGSILCTSLLAPAIYFLVFKPLLAEISNRKSAEQLLRFSEELFRGTFEQAAVGICNVSLDGRYFRVNQWMCDILGYTTEEMLTHSVMAVTHPEDRLGTHEHLQQVIDGRIDSYAMEKRYVRKDGTTVWVNITTSLTRKSSGEPDYFIGIIQDITQRMEVEESLRRSEKLLSEAQEMANLGWYLFDITHGKWESSKILDEIFGIDADYVRDLEHWLELVAPESRPEMAEHLAHVIRTGERFNKDYRIIRLRNGEERWVSGIGELELDAHGEPARLIGTIQDITERRRAENELKASEERFSQVFAQDDDALLILKTGSLEIIDSNPKALSLFGLTAESLSRVRPDSFMNARDFRKFTEALAINDASRGFLIDRIVCSTAGGAAIDVSLRAKILSLKNESVIFCSLRDITEKISLEEEIRSTQAKLIHTNKMTSLGMLASSIAHEVNNPNNYISINAKMLARIWQDARPILRKACDELGGLSLMRLPFDKVEDMAPRLFDAIIDGSSRITAIVDNMKNFVRAGSKGLQEELQVNGLMQNAITLLWHHINKHTDNFRTSLQDDIPTVKGNGQQIEQVIINLITNALEALPDKTSGVAITTAWDRESGKVSISVRDEGKGMDRNILERIAEPFFTTKHDRGGTGLGLYISDSIIKGHKGRLLFESESGKGTIATILLPAG